MDFPTATADISTKKVIDNLFPNPVSDIFTAVTASASNYNLFDALGKQQKTGIFHEGINKINVENLPNGVYFLQLNDKNNLNLETRKIVVSR